MAKIEQWSQVKHRASRRPWDALLLGNGASVAVSSKFAYSSLFQVAKKSYLSPGSLAIFKHFQTTNFEVVLKRLADALAVNRALHVRGQIVQATYDQVRQALFDAVTSVHPERREIAQHLQPIASFCSRFGSVVSLNYDLLLYWAMMSQGKCVDMFLSGRFRPRAVIERHPRTTRVGYAHGNLVLSLDAKGRTQKLKSNRAGLLATLSANWGAKRSAPVFVSEGDSNQKLSAIGANTYLRYVHQEMLHKLSGKVLCYGLSFSESDAHLIKAVANAKIDSLAISIFTGSGARVAQESCSRIAKALREAGLRIRPTFVDAQSEGLWIH